MRYIFLVLSLLFSSLGFAKPPMVIDIIQSENFTHRYQNFLNGRSVQEVNDFHATTKGSHIEIVEMILLQQALILGGIDKPIVFNPKPSVNILEYSDLISGDSLILARSVWHEDILDYRGSLYVSEPLVKFGEYEAGLYVAKRNLHLHNIQKNQLDNLTVVANPRWKVDWRALHNTELNIVSFIGPWETMLEMVETNVVDTMLVNFSVSETLELNFENRLYVPINNLKVFLPDSRHFVVSKRHPEGKVVFEALNKGLAILRENGTIEKALKQSGFINEKVTDWQTINIQMLNPGQK
ncbi:hypothetical protein C1E23_09930 [Pseudoalteromonas phenolica]|uniref:Solute-binding protein family 3/N-terminal domain-containing protein n=1 Tax=Pseudoalteromonas phenolica TaxID=161398 RepID=A0A4Q7IMV9_9GAMM|nr:hypothetical protein [Pseudoalteromonas phenolica]RZQ53240.1 hypothetical protein C1E23_09930 [Pseudoalteromonas phenolica]